MRKSVLALGATLMLILPAALPAGAQVAPSPPAGVAPRGADTPVAPVPGAGPSIPPNALPATATPLPSVDSGGANRSSDSATGEAKPPIGAPRLPGEPANPPTGPED